MRFIHDIFEFNDKAPALNLAYHVGRPNSKEVGLPNIKREPRKLLLEILAFCLMKNHFHLLVKPRTDDALTVFMRKLGTGYTNYFNQKYERSGALFEGIYKAVPVEREVHFVHLPYYIHLNPLDLVTPKWREGEVKDYKKAMKFLENYRWSSYLDYIGKKNFPSVTQREFLSEFFNGPEEYKKDTIKWLKEIDLEQVKHLTLE